MHGCKSRFTPSGSYSGYALPLPERIRGFISKLGLQLLASVLDMLFAKNESTGV